MVTEKKDKERIAKVIARAGLASRRGAEKLISEGRVKVNGEIILSPALNLSQSDRILVDNKVLPSAQTTRLWRYNKPVGLVTSEKDEKNREVVFDNLPKNLPRVMSIGRLDLNSEGLLLLTNDGDLKRKLELPSTGWSRKYRVRINGNPSEENLEPLRLGITLNNENLSL
jgi:23S rRNA pseudouridine2605 synthase